MCDHLECHGGKLKVYRVTDAYILGSYDEELGDFQRRYLDAWWEVGFKSGGFPVATADTWSEAMAKAWKWLSKQ